MKAFKSATLLALSAVLTQDNTAEASTASVYAATCKVFPTRIEVAEGAPTAMGSTTLLQRDGLALQPVIVTSNWARLMPSTPYNLALVEDDVADCGSENTIIDFGRFLSTPYGTGGDREKSYDISLIESTQRDDVTVVVGKWLSLTLANTAEKVACC